jgi:hypothetical protein
MEIKKAAVSLTTTAAWRRVGERARIPIVMRIRGRVRDISSPRVVKSGGTVRQARPTPGEIRSC